MQAWVRNNNFGIELGILKSETATSAGGDSSDTQLRQTKAAVRESLQLSGFSEENLALLEDSDCFSWVEGSRTEPAKREVLSDIWEQCCNRTPKDDTAHDAKKSMSAVRAAVHSGEEAKSADTAAGTHAETANKTMMLKKTARFQPSP